MKVLVDHNLSPRIARALNEIFEADGDQIVALREKFRPNTPDVDWIGALGDEGGWSIISEDLRITRNPAERAAWRSTGLIGFFLERGWRKKSVAEKTARLMLKWDVLRRQHDLVTPGSMFMVPLTSKKLRPLPL